MNPKTWADGLGVWRASVPLSGSRHKDALRARKMILGELEQREARLDPTTIRVTREHVTNHGTAVYREEIR